MKKVIILSTDVYTDLNYYDRKSIKNIFKKLIENENKVVFISRNENKKSALNDIDFKKKKYILIQDQI